MAYPNPLENNFLHSCICIILLILFGNSTMHAQEADKLSEVNLALEKIMDADQNLRERFNCALDGFGDNSPEFMLATRNLNISDSINQKQIDSIFHQYGWLTAPRVSEKASKAYFYVIQHGQYEFQKKYKSAVILAFKNGVIDRQEFNFFIDRLAIREQKYQKYGTQIMTDNMGNNYFVPIDTTNNSTSHFLKEIELRMRNKDFILFSNPDYITLFVHVFNPDTNEPVSSIIVSLDDKKVSMTNAKGFFQMLIPREKGESLLTVTDANTGKKQLMRLKFHEPVDFFDTYFGFR